MTMLTPQELKQVSKLQNQACGLLNQLVDNGLGVYEAQVYNQLILFELAPKTAIEDLKSLINNFNQMS